MNYPMVYPTSKRKSYLFRCAFLTNEEFPNQKQGICFMSDSAESITQYTAIDQTRINKQHTCMEIHRMFNGFIR